MKKLLIILICGGVALCILIPVSIIGILGNVSISVTDPPSREVQFSRAYIRESSEALNFGSDPGDTDDFALNYAYNNKELQEKYGATFTADDIKKAISGTLVLGFQKAEGISIIEIQGDEWALELSKGWIGRWKVTKMYAADEDTLSKWNQSKGMTWGE